MIASFPIVGPVSRPTRGPWRWLVGLALALTVLAGCAPSAVTGRDQLLLISPQQERQMGAEQFPQIVRSMGGEYRNANLQRYVTEVGRRAGAASDMPTLDYQFVLIDTDQVNAFALPGGFVGITRGLLAQANNEGEMAAVLAHEVAHVTARHSAERVSQSVLTDLGAGLLGAVTGMPALGQAASVGGQMMLLRYSQSQEFEADAIGLRYLHAAGYDPRAMAEFLRQLDRETELNSLITGQPRSQPSYFSTHPATPERVARARALAAEAPSPTTHVNRAGYLQAIDGMTYGPSAAQGLLHGDRFGHVEDGFVWQVPAGFQAEQSGPAVLLRGPNGTMAMVDSVTLPQSRTAREYLLRDWSAQSRLDQVEDLTINGYPAATGTARGTMNGTTVDARFVVAQVGANRMVRFLLATPPQHTARMDEPLRRLTYSLRPMQSQERGAFQPMRIRIVTVGSGDTVASLSRRLPFPDHQEARFRALNGLEPGQPLVAGQQVKLIVQ